MLEPMPRASLIFARILLAGMAVSSIGCSYALMAHHHVAGADFDEQAAARGFAEGTSTAEIRAALGEPFEHDVRSGREIWHYYSAYSERACVVRLLGVIPVSRPSKVTSEARFVFESDALTEQIVRIRRGLQPPDR